MGNVYHTKEEMIDCVNAFYEGMVQRSEEIKRHRTIRRAKTMPIWDCHLAFLSLMNMWRFLKCWGQKGSVSLLSQLKKIVMLGRQAGYFLIVEPASVSRRKVFLGRYQR